MKKHALLLLMVGCWMGMPCASAQTATSYNERESLTADAVTGALVLSWWGKAGRTYFVQQSYDLVHWNYVPYVEIGAEAICGVNFTCSDPRQFWRLNYIDVSTGGLSAGDADADGDGLSNNDELNIYHTDPLKSDSDGDGIWDADEAALGSNPNVNDWTPRPVEFAFDDANRLTGHAAPGQTAAVFISDSEGNVGGAP
jgi:hypothetical protein